jgi:hypothetical protein
MVIFSYFCGTRRDIVHFLSSDSAAGGNGVEIMGSRIHTILAHHSERYHDRLLIYIRFLGLNLIL